jgi:L,D-transpeptidase YcbB
MDFVNLFKYDYLLKSQHFPLPFLIILCWLGFSTCSPEKTKTVILVEKPEKINDKINQLLQKELGLADTSKTILVLEDSLHATKEIVSFYTLRKYEAVWTHKGLLNADGDSLFSLLKNVDEFGLVPDDYHFSKIDKLISTAKDSASKKFDAIKLFKADLLFTDAFFQLAVHVSKGRLNPDSLIAEWHLEKLDTNLVLLLDDAVKHNTLKSLIESLEPKNEPYQKLKAALRAYKKEFKDVEWVPLASRESDSITFTQRLKERLIASHDYLEVASGNDSIKLLKSIKNFQCKYHLVEDGKIGKLTFKALQQTKQDVINQIAMNMERWRWNEPPKEKQYVWVNIPKFEMHVMEEDTLIMRSRVIAGAPKTPTPLLKSTIRYFTIYPYWTVPYSIIKKEILPILKRDTSYLRRKNFEVLDRDGYVIDTMINWKKYSANYFPFKLRQRIGDDNSLGILKFNFHNKYGVYMHDTDNRKLFTWENRALSHGCVRLEKFFDFAKFLVRDDSLKYPVDSLQADLGREIQKQINLKRPIPIYINYFTAEVDEYNELHLYIDVYKRDEKMLRSLKRK